jgi:ADP-heptose:LPS heptosyltransferase
MSLPYILKLEKITPNTINYINDDVNNNSYWKNKLTTFDNKLKVGFVYSGLLISYIDKYIQLHDFRDICNDNRFQTFCIHQNDNTISSDFLNIDFADKIIRYDNFDTTKSFLDTVSLLHNIDILVTIDTSIAHIAGVMGVKTLLLIGYTSEWRWFDTDDKVWYESIQIIRMNQQKPLAELLPRIKNILIMEYENKYLT